MTLSSSEKRKTKKKKKKKHWKFLIRFFVFRHMFSSCFLTNETYEKLATVFGSDQNIFAEEDIFCLIFLFRHQVFHRYKIFDLNRWRNGLNLQNQTENVDKI